MYRYSSIAQLVELAAHHQTTISEIALRHEMELSGATATALLGQMADRLAVMQAAAQRGLARREPIPGGMVGGDARRLSCGPGLFLGRVPHLDMHTALALD